VQWLRDQLGIIAGAAESETLAAQVKDTGGVYFVPAFSGLFAPYWRSDARGAIVGLSRYSTNAHLARATLEAICYQTRDVVEAMRRDSGVALDVLRVDGGVTANELCMQLQADILGVPVSRPVVAETTALGAAYAAGLAVGFWSSPDELRRNWREGKRWEPRWDAGRRDEGYAEWRKAVERTFGWVDVDRR
jgi:glycerol kinase